MNDIIYALFSIIIAVLPISAIIDRKAKKTEQKTTIIENERFEIYQEYYFTAVRDPLGNNIDEEKSKIVFLKLYDRLMSNPKESMLFSLPIIELLNHLKSNQNQSTLIELKIRFEKEFIKIRNQAGYKTRSKKINLIYSAMVCIFTTCIIVMFCIAGTMIYNSIWSREYTNINSITYITLFIIHILLLELSFFALHFIVENDFYVHLNKQSLLYSIKSFLLKVKNKSKI